MHHVVMVFHKIAFHFFSDNERAYQIHLRRHRNISHLVRSKILVVRLAGQIGLSVLVGRVSDANLIGLHPLS
jgi:hypothetical protein